MATLLELARAITPEWRERHAYRWALEISERLGPNEYGAQALWRVDPVNGRDDAAGTPVAPLQTFTEYARRLGVWGPSVAQTVELAGDLLPSDAIVTPWPAGPNVPIVTVVGQRTTTASSTVGAFTTKDEPTNVRASLTQAGAIVPGLWAGRIALGTMIVFPASGVVCFPLEDLGNNEAALSELSGLDPIVGAAFDVVRLTSVPAIVASAGLALANLSTSVAIVDGVCEVLVDTCAFGSLTVRDPSRVNLTFSQVFGQLVSTGELEGNGTAIVGTATIAAGRTRMAFAVVQGAIETQNGAYLDAADLGVFGAPADGITVRDHGVLNALALWGASNAGIGCVISPAGTFRKDTTNPGASVLALTGAGGAFKLGTVAAGAFPAVYTKDAASGAQFIVG